jgi:predicted Rossmann-fold nucleotide-binding protein
MKSLRIDMGAPAGKDAFRAECSFVLAKILVFDDYRVPYGGADVGLAGIIADASADTGAPREIFGTNGVRDRKLRAFELAEAFLDLPGGYGPIEEASAFLLRARRGRGLRPLSFFSVRDFRGHIDALLDRAAIEGFIRPERGVLIVSMGSARSSGAESAVAHVEEERRRHERVPVIGGAYDIDGLALRD